MNDWLLFLLAVASAQVAVTSAQVAVTSTSIVILGSGAGHSEGGLAYLFFIFPGREKVPPYLPASLPPYLHTYLTFTYGTFCSSFLLQAFHSQCRRIKLSTSSRKLGLIFPTSSALAKCGQGQAMKAINPRSPFMLAHDLEAILTCANLSPHTSFTAS